VLEKNHGTHETLVEAMGQTTAMKTTFLIL
jgi:hypothetical protein